MPVSGWGTDFAAAKRRREKLAARKRMKWERIKAQFSSARLAAPKGRAE